MLLLVGDVPSSSRARPPLSAVLYVNLNSAPTLAQLISPGPVSCVQAAAKEGERGGRKEVERKKEREGGERGSWKGSRSMQSLEVKTKGMCVTVK